MRNTKPGCRSDSTFQPTGAPDKKVRCSVTLCNEEYACAVGREAEASFTCEQCRTNQCTECERRLHELSRYADHNRHPLVPPDPNALCNSPSSICCRPRNFADLVCDDCDNQGRFCFDCDARYHISQPLSTHRRRPCEEYLARRNYETTRVHNESNSPVSDDSLPYFSLPNSSAVVCQNIDNHNSALASCQSTADLNDAKKATPRHFTSNTNKKSADGSKCFRGARLNNSLSDKPLSASDSAIIDVQTDTQANYKQPISNWHSLKLASNLEESLMIPLCNDDMCMKSFELANHNGTLLVSDNCSF